MVKRIFNKEVSKLINFVILVVMLFKCFCCLDGKYFKIVLFYSSVQQIDWFFYHFVLLYFTRTINLGYCNCSASLYGVGLLCLLWNQEIMGQIKNLTCQIVKLMLLELDFKCSFLWFKVYLKVSLYMIAGYIQAEKKQVLSKIADTFTSEVWKILVFFTKSN